MKQKKQHQKWKKIRWGVPIFFVASSIVFPASGIAQEMPQVTEVRPAQTIEQEYTQETEKTQSDEHSILVTTHANETGTAFTPQEIAEALGVSNDAVENVIPNTNGTTSYVVQLDVDVTPANAIAIMDSTSLEQVVVRPSLIDIPVTAEPNIKRHITTTAPNDPLYSSQWHHTGSVGSLNSPEGWDITTGAPSIVVAVIDTGVDLDHPDLVNRIWNNTDEVAGNGIDDDGNGYIDDAQGYDFTSSTADPNPSPDGIDNDGNGDVDGGATHGTHVAGILGAEGNNGAGVSGVMWQGQIMPIQVLDDEGSGYDADIASGIRYAADNGADIINLSLGGYGSTTVLANAVEYALGKGALIIAAAGNNGENLNTNPFYPACYSDVYGVGAVGQSAAPSSFSNYGSDCIDVSAPGEFIYSTLLIDPAHGFSTSYGLESGTSMATPMVSGVAGLILAAHPDATRTQILELLTSSSRSITGLSSDYGIGIVDASKVGQQLLLQDVSAYDTNKKKVKFSSSFVYNTRTPYFVWTTNGDTVASYYVYFGEDKNADPRTKGTNQTAKTYTASSISGNEKSYYLRVQGVDAGGQLTNILTYQYIVDTVVSAPTKTHLKKVSHQNKIKVTWKKVSGQNVATYQIFRKDPGRKARLIARVKHPRESYIDTHVKVGKKYQYYIKAVDDLGNTKTSKKMTIRIK